MKNVKYILLFEALMKHYCKNKTGSEKPILLPQKKF